MASQSKTQLLNNIHTLLKRRYKPKVDRNASRLSVLSAVVYGICHEDTTREHANQALSRFNDQFYDWNEIRVSSVDEIQQTLAGIPEPETRAQRIRRFLRQLFNRTYSFSLDALAKKPLKEALKVLRTYDAFESDYVTATVIQHALGGHAIPVDKPGHRAASDWASRSLNCPRCGRCLKRAVPKNRGAEFLDLIEDLANDTCVEGEPDCIRCELRKICMFAMNRKTEPRPAGRTGGARAAKEPVKTAKGKPAEAPHPKAPKKSAPKSAKDAPARASRAARRAAAPSSRGAQPGESGYGRACSVLRYGRPREDSRAWHISRRRAKISRLASVFDRFTGTRDRRDRRG